MAYVLDEPTPPTTLDLIQRLYALHDQPGFFEQVLSTLGQAFEARDAFALIGLLGTTGLQPAASLGYGGQAIAELSGPDRERLRERLCQEAVRDETRLDPGHAEALHLRFLAELGAPHALTLVAHHRERGSTLWVLARGAAFSPTDEARATILATNIGFAGELALRRGAQLGERTVGPGPTFRARPTPLPRLTDGLPARVVQCLRLAARGYSDGEIAGRLHISETTVARELRRGYGHLGVAGRHELPVPELLSES